LKLGERKRDVGKKWKIEGGKSIGKALDTLFLGGRM
jgi:hypothetical protein